MEIRAENIEKLNVGEHPGARLCKGLLLDAIEAGDKLEAIVKQQEQRIDELKATISKMETTQKWVRVKDSLPKEGEVIYGAGKFIEGLFVLQNEEWYTKEEYDDFAYEEAHGYNIDAIDFWMEKPKKPTTEGK